MIKQTDTREKIMKWDGKTTVEDHFGCLGVTISWASQFGDPRKETNTTLSQHNVE